MLAKRRLDDSHYQYALARRGPVLSPEQEQSLAQRYRRNRDQHAADELVRAHLRIVTSLASKYRNYSLPTSELIAEGNCGLVYALGRFDPERGVRFATYAAHWVRAYMLTYVLRSWSIVMGTSGPLRSQMFFKFRRERARFRAILGDGDAAEQALARTLNVSVERVREMGSRLDAVDVSLDAPLGHDSARPVGATLCAQDDPERNVHEARVGGNVVRAVRSALTVLDARERYIVETRLMADNGQEQSLAQIARVFGISRERARQLEARAKRKLKDSVIAHGDPVVAELTSAGY